MSGRAAASISKPPGYAGFMRLPCPSMIIISGRSSLQALQTAYSISPATKSLTRLSMMMQCRTPCIQEVCPVPTIAALCPAEFSSSSSITAVVRLPTAESVPRRATLRQETCP